MKAWKAAAFIGIVSASFAAPANKLVLILPVTDERLIWNIRINEMMKSLLLHHEDVAWAAYFAGKEAVYRQLLAELHAIHGLPPHEP